MGNSLLDFVMALVRDPEVAARYAADPAGALADAHLTGVTIADVNNLIPVVTDSLAAATPGFGSASSAFGSAADPANVWTTGAAAAAFDAFDIHIPQPEPVHQPAVVLQPEHPPVDQPSAETAADVAPAPIPDVPDHQPPDPMSPEWADPALAHPEWQHPHADAQDHHPDGHSGLELF